MSKFKVGDWVKITSHSCTGCEVGGVYPLVSTKSQEDLHAASDCKKGDGCSCEENWELVKSKRGVGRPPKEKAVEYIVGYKSDIFATAYVIQKEYTSRKELDAWLKEAVDDRKVVFDSIRVYKVTKTLIPHIAKKSK